MWRYNNSIILRTAGSKCGNIKGALGQKTNQAADGQGEGAFCSLHQTKGYGGNKSYVPELQDYKAWSGENAIIFSNCKPLASNVITSFFK